MTSVRAAARLVVDDLTAQLKLAQAEYQEAEDAWKAAEERMSAAARRLEDVRRAGRAVCRAFGIEESGAGDVS